MTAHGVDFVDEDDARRILLRLFEHVAHAGRADADEHLNEIGARNAEERHIGLPRDGAGEQRLAGAGRADQQRALWNLAAEAVELGRVLEEIDDLGQFLTRDRKSVVSGKSVSVRVDLGGRRIIKKKIKPT